MITPQSATHASGIAGTSISMEAASAPLASPAAGSLSSADPIMGLVRFFQSKLDTTPVPQWRTLTHEGFHAFIKEFDAYRLAGGNRSIRGGLSAEALALIEFQNPELGALLVPGVAPVLTDCSLDCWGAVVWTPSDATAQTENFLDRELSRIVMTWISVLLCDCVFVCFHIIIIIIIT